MRISICKACQNNARGVKTRLSVPHTCIEHQKIKTKSIDANLGLFKMNVGSYPQKPDNQPESIEDLGDLLCSHCPLQNKNVYSVPGGYVAGCEGSRCKEAYENYLTFCEENQ